MPILDFNEMFFTPFEPKQSNRFYISTLEGVPGYLVKGVSAISLSQTAVALNHINIQRYVKGKTIWQPITFTLYEAITPSGGQAVMEWVRLGHESVTGRDGYSDFYKKDIVFNTLGPVGDKVEEWTLKGAFISAATFGDMDWATEDPVNIELTLKYDYAILQF